MQELGEGTETLGTWAKQYLNLHPSLVLILDGSSEIGTHVISDLCYLICLWHLIRSRAVTKIMFFFRN